jgi:DAK2 domain fusion protein YloV
MLEEKQYDGRAFKQALKSAEIILEKRIEEINSLNVFPVPDGDTGINMYLTLQSANAAVENLDTTSAAEISAQAARGALLGARGNSGVILSQILQGIAKGMATKESFSAVDFAQCLHHASETAYQALAQPVEGTILTVIREASEAALKQAGNGANLKETISAIASQAKETVDKTPELLPRLKEAGVVDAGGKGLFYFFMGMKDFFCRKIAQYKEFETSHIKPQLATRAIEYGYDVQFLIEGNNLPLVAIRSKVESMGESVLVVGDKHIIRVHVHTTEPQAVMDYCSSKGTLKDIISDNMDKQVKAFKQKHHNISKRKTRVKSKASLSESDVFSAG